MNNVPWHVLQVISNHERKVLQHLAVQSLEYCLPCYTERVRWSDRTVVTERPLFPGYVFARLFRQSRVSAISIPGVLRILGNEERDLVSSAELEQIRAALEQGLILRPHPGIPIGTRVRVHSGVFAGVEGIVTEFRQECRVVINLAAINQSFSLEVEAGNIDVLKPPR